MISHVICVPSYTLVSFWADNFSGWSTFDWQHVFSQLYQLSTCNQQNIKKTIYLIWFHYGSFWYT